MKSLTRRCLNGIDEDVCRVGCLFSEDFRGIICCKGGVFSEIDGYNALALCTRICRFMLLTNVSFLLTCEINLSSDIVVSDTVSTWKKMRLDNGNHK